jgi:predicted RNA-binding Zn-ribbon protein involved in translation (DUF1610 family)
MSLKDIFRNAKRGGKYNLCCPVCGSKQIYKLHSLEWLMPQQYYCAICGYSGSFLIDIREETKDDTEVHS